MTVSGVTLLALCTLLGAALGDLLGLAIGVKANVGGVGIAMIFLMIARGWLFRHGLMTPPLRLGVEFWGAMYIPIVIAMAAQQNVVAAVEGGPMVVVLAILTVLICFATVAALGRTGGPMETMDEIEARQMVQRGSGGVTADLPTAREG